MDDFGTLVGLVERYSPSGEERGVVEWLVRRMQALGFGKTFVDEVGNAVGVVGNGPKQVILLGHIDTVPGEIPVRFEPDPLAPLQNSGEGRILYGRGTVDAKGPLACFVDALAQIGVVAGWQFVIVGAVDEERDSVGARFLVDRYQPDYAIIGEPSNWDRVALGYKGSAWADVVIRQRQTHTASGEQTAAENAIEAWLLVKSYADAFNDEKQRAFDKIMPTLRGMDSGQDGFEQWAKLRIGVRLPMEVIPEKWYLELVHTLKLLKTSNISVEQVGYPVPAWESGKNSPLVRAFLHGIRQAGGAPRFVYKTGTADLNVVAPVWGCPAVVYGPGDSALDHTPNEHLSLEEYKKSVVVLAGAIRKLIE